MAVDSNSKRSAAGLAAVYYGAIGTVLVVFAAIAYIDFGRLFLLNEYRQWSEGSVFFNPLTLFAPGTVFNASAFSVAFSRAFTFEVVAGLRSACGSNAPCHDAFHIALLCASGLLLGLIALRLFPMRPVLFIAGSVAFMLSAQPVFDALAWQATLLDKLALFFTALGTYVIARADVRREDFAYSAGINALILVIVIAAYNSKEASFPLLPSLVVLLAVRFAGGMMFSWRILMAAFGKSLSWLAAPALYAVFHVAVVFYNRTYVLPAEGQRVTGGNAAFDLFHYDVYMFNLGPLADFLHLYPYAPESVLIWYAVVIVALTAAFCFLIVKIGTRTTASLWIWALVSFLLAFVIPLRTATISPFYLLVPLFYLAMLLCVTAVALWEAARTLPVRACIQAVVALALALHVWGLAWSYPSYIHVAQMSDNFTAALPAIKQRVLTGHPRGIVFLWPKSEPLTYMFLGSPENRGLALYLSPPQTPPAVLASIDAKIRDESYDDGPLVRAKPGELSVVLGPLLKLERIESAP